MRTNGYLTYRISGEPAFNDDGEPVAAADTQPDKIKCFIETNTHNVNGKYSDGEFTVSSYTVLAQRGSVPADINSVHLYRKDSRKEQDLGEFEVQDNQEISLDRIKITV
jgi:hypothetical protein